MGKIRKPDAKEALAYVRAHSPNEETLLEGLLKFTERWLEQVKTPFMPSTHLHYMIHACQPGLLVPPFMRSIVWSIHSMHEGDLMPMCRWHSRSSEIPLSSRHRPRCMPTMRCEYRKLGASTRVLACSRFFVLQRSH